LAHNRGYVQVRLCAAEGAEPLFVGEQRIDREGKDAQQKAPATSATQCLHQQRPHDQARDENAGRRAAELPAVRGCGADKAHQIDRGAEGDEKQRDVVPGDAVKRRLRPAWEDQEGEG
jgi:hypothetical protein